MTYQLNLPDHIKARLEEKANEQKVAPEDVAVQILTAALGAAFQEESKRENLARLTQELFDKRQSAYSRLAEGAP